MQRYEKTSEPPKKYQRNFGVPTRFDVLATDAAYPAAPIASISTNAPFGNVFTATAERAG